jgi:hypothetical protein
MPVCCIGIIFLINLITQTQTGELRGFCIRRGHVDPIVSVLELGRMRTRES